MKKLWLSLAFLLTFFSTAKELTQKEMLELIKKTNAIELEIQKQELTWKEESQVLKLQVDLLNKQIEAAKNDKSKKQDLLSKLQIKVNDVNERKLALLKTKTRYQDLLNAHKKELVQKWHNNLPQGLKELISNELEALTKEHALTQSLEDIQVYTEAYLDLQSKLHLVTETHLINDKKWQVSCLYIGTAQGYFINKDLSLCGTLTLSNSIWLAKSELSMLKEISSAFSQFDREGRPELVKLKLGAK
jgi:hypothetical protein